VTRQLLNTHHFHASTGRTGPRNGELAQRTTFALLFCARNGSGPSLEIHVLRRTLLVALCNMPWERSKP
jgi:hypothetical protein